MIGGAFARRLVQAGHEVVLAGRREGADGLRLDFAAMPPHQELAGQLRGFDLVVNAAGIFQPQGKQSFDAVHVNGVRALAEAAIGAGVPRIVHVSALGADAASDLGYFASKGAAEDYLLALPAMTVVVVRPSLVFSPDGGSTRFFARLATSPLAPLPGGGRQRVQPIHLDDLVEAMLRAATSAPASMRLDAVGPRALPLREYLAGFARALGRRPRFVGVPMRLLMPLMPLAARLGGGLASRDSLRMLAAGNTGDATAITRLLGRMPRDPRQFIDLGAAGALRGPLRVQRAVAWMRAGLAALWLGTAWVSLWGYPREGSLALLARLDLHGTWATLALWSGALLDAAFGVATLLLPRRRRLYQAQLLLITAYSVLISVGLPEFWLHPFAPLLKNVPIMAMIVALLLLDRTDGPGDR